MDAHRNAHQGRQTSDANTGISRLPRYLPNALAVSGVKRAIDGSGVAGEIAAMRQARLEREAEVAQRFFPVKEKKIQKLIVMFWKVMMINQQEMVIG